jgi:hypothetical protein
MSRGGSVSIATSTDWGPAFDSTQGDEFLNSTAFRPVLGPTQTPIHWLSGCLPRVKRTMRYDTDHSHPVSIEVKNGGAIPPSLDTSSWLNNLSTGTNFPFTCLPYFHTNIKWTADQSGMNCLCSVDTQIVGSYPTLSMDVCVFILCVCGFVCCPVYVTALRRADPPSKESYRPSKIKWTEVNRSVSWMPKWEKHE